MKKKPAVLLLFTVSLLLITGCATSKIDWDSRTGSYNFDMAVLEKWRNGVGVRGFQGIGLKSPPTPAYTPYADN